MNAVDDKPTLPTEESQRGPRADAAEDDVSQLAKALEIDHQMGIDYDVSRFSNEKLIEELEQEFPGANLYGVCLVSEISTRLQRKRTWDYVICSFGWISYGVFMILRMSGYLK